jgi:hypothetical protein
MVPHIRPLDHPLGVSELMVWSAGLALPAILASMSLGYFAARWILARRPRQQVS